MSKYKNTFFFIYAVKIFFYFYRFFIRTVFRKVFMQLNVVERFYRWGGNNDKLRSVIQYDRMLYKNLISDILHHYPNNSLPVWRLEFAIFVACHAPASSYVIGRRRKTLTMVYQQIGKSKDDHHLELLLITHLELSSIAIAERRLDEAEFQIDLLNRVVRLNHLTQDGTKILQMAMCNRVVHLKNLPSDDSITLYRLVKNILS